MRTELSLSDEWETPQELYNHLCETYQIYPNLDVACTTKNRRCRSGCHIDLETDGLDEEWDRTNLDTPAVVWCNPPHSLNEEFVKKAYNEWAKNNITIMMILPANSLCTNYAEHWIEPFTEYHPINRKFCKFLYYGEKKDSSRNGYFVVIWRKR